MKPAERQHITMGFGIGAKMEDMDIHLRVGDYRCDYLAVPLTVGWLGITTFSKDQLAEETQEPCKDLCVCYSCLSS